MAPIAVVSPTLQMMCKVCRVLGGDELHHRNLYQGPLTSGKLSELSHEFISVPDLSWHTLFLGSQLAQEFNWVFSLWNVLVPASACVFDPSDYALLELPVKHR